MHPPAAAGDGDTKRGQDACRSSNDAASRQAAEETAKDRLISRDHDLAGRHRQDQVLLQPAMTSSSGAAASSRRVQHGAEGKLAHACSADAAAPAGDRQQPRDVAEPHAGVSAFAASSMSSLPHECSTSAGGDAGSYQRQPRGVEAMLGGQRRSHSGALAVSPSALSEHGSLLVERAASSSSTHRALLGGVSPHGAPAASAALLELSDNTSSPGNAAAAAAHTGTTLPGRDAAQQQQRGGPAAGGAAGALAAAEGASARRPPGITRPTVLIPSPLPASYYGIPSSRPMGSPASAPVHPYSGAAIPYDELDLDAIDDISGVDAFGCSSSSSPTISGAGVTRGSAAGAHLRGSRDLDLRRAALLNMLSPSMQQGTPVSLGGSGAQLSVQAEGPVLMFTGPTRARALPGSNNSLQSVASGADQYTSSESTDTAQMLHSLRLSRGSTPSPAPTASPARPRSAAGLAAAAAAGAAATATPRMGTLLSTSRGSSATASPVPPPAHGAAAALLAGSVVASPRTPHSPLSAILSPRPGSARVLSEQGTSLPGPLFGSGFGPNAAAAGADACPSPGTDSSGSMPSYAAAGAAVRGSSILAGAGAPPHAARRPSRLVPGTPAAAGDAEQQQQQPPDVHAQTRQHDTRYGPHGCSPFSPLHHRQELPPRGDQGFSPTCPHPLVPPALTLLGSSHSRLSADTSAAAAGASPAHGAASSGRSAGGVGHWSIREWLDHHPWSLPYEVPAGLRDAADIRDAAALEQQQQQPSRLGGSSGSSGSRVPSRSSSNPHISVSSLDSPGGGLLQQQSPGALSTPSRLPAAAGTPGILSEGPVPSAAAGYGLDNHHQLQQQQQHQQHSHRHLQLELLQGRQLSVLAAEHAARDSCSHSCGRDDDTQRQLDSGSPRSDSRSVPSSQRSVRSAGTPPPAFQQLSIEASGPCADMQRALRFQPVSPAERAGVRAPATLGPTAGGRPLHSLQQQRRVSPSPLQHVSIPVGNSMWRPDQGQLADCQLGLVLPQAMSGPCAASSSSSNAWGSIVAGAMATGPQAARTSCQQDYSSLAAAAAAQQRVCESHRASAGSCSDGSVAAAGSSGCSSVVQLGAGHHLFPAGSPTQQRSCCTSYRHSDSAPPTHHTPGAAAGSSSMQASAGRSSCPGDFLALQQQAFAALQPQGGLHVSPGACGRVLRPQEQEVLPGVAELLQRRHEQEQQRASRNASVAAGSSRPATGLTAAVCASLPGPVDAGQAASATAAVLLQQSDAAPGVAADACSSSSLGQGCEREGHDESSSLHVASAPATTTSSSREVSRSCDSCDDAVAAGLLCDQGFVTSMIASLPGVDPHSPLVWEAVTELQEALSQQQGVASAQQQQHRMMEPP